MTANEPVLKAFNDFGIDDMPTQAEISRRMPRRLEDIDNAITAGPLTPTARATLESSVFAHAVVELETQSSRRWAMQRTLGRFLATVIVCAIMVFLIWWIVGALAVVVLVVVGVKVWQWSTTIRPPKPRGSPRSKPALIAASVGLPAAGPFDRATPASARAADGDRALSSPLAG